MDIPTFLTHLRTHGELCTVPNISDKTAQFLKDIIRISGVKNLLEIGTANGYSTINLAEAIRENNGYILTIDHSLPSYNQAVANIKMVGMDDIVTLVFANAIEYIPMITDTTFDMLFIDGHKRRTIEFFRRAYPLLRDGGVVIIDDVIKFAHKMSNFYEFLEENNVDYSVLKIDEDDGVIMIVKIGKNKNIPLSIGGEG